jgi:hypothetical protein
MGNTPSRDGGVADPTGGTDCAHPAIGATDTAEVATAVDQYTTRHNPFVWFHSIIDNTAECDANVVPLGTLGANGQPSPSGHLAVDLRREKTTPRFAFITPNLCSDGHDGTCAGTNSTGGHVGGLTGADQFLQAWMPLILDSPAYKHGDTLVVITFDEADVDQSDPSYAASCCNEVTGPNTHAPGNAGLATDTAPGGGQIGALLLNPKYIVPGSTDTTGSYNHYSALRSYEDLLGLTTGGTDGQGHLGFAAAGLAPFGTDVFNSRAAAKARQRRCLRCPVGCVHRLSLISRDLSRLIASVGHRHFEQLPARSGGSVPPGNSRRGGDGHDHLLEDAAGGVNEGCARRIPPTRAHSEPDALPFQGTQTDQLVQLRPVLTCRRRECGIPVGGEGGGSRLRQSDPLVLRRHVPVDHCLDHPLHN